MSEKNTIAIGFDTDGDVLLIVTTDRETDPTIMIPFDPEKAVGFAEAMIHCANKCNQEADDKLAMSIDIPAEITVRGTVKH